MFFVRIVELFEFSFGHGDFFFIAFGSELDHHCVELGGDLIPLTVGFEKFLQGFFGNFGFSLFYIISSFYCSADCFDPMIDHVVEVFHFFVGHDHAVGENLALLLADKLVAHCGNKIIFGIAAFFKSFINKLTVNSFFKLAFFVAEHVHNGFIDFFFRYSDLVAFCQFIYGSNLQSIRFGLFGGNADAQQIKLAEFIVKIMISDFFAENCTRNFVAGTTAEK